MHLAASQPYLLNQDGTKIFNPQAAFYAVVGIGFPQRFYQTLQNLGIEQFQCHEFPDHHDYDIEDLQFDDNNPIITTEKDAVKIMALLKQYPDFKQDIWVVPVDAVLSPDCYTVLQQQLQQYGIQISQGSFIMKHIVIPARFASSRLPGKPLLDIHGRPMILRVVDQAKKAQGF